MHPSHMLYRPLLLLFCLLSLSFLCLPATGHAKQQRLSQFAQKVYNWGKDFSKRLPVGWRMEWTPSRLSEIHWDAAPAEGYRIRFVHETRKVYIPRPIIEIDKPTMQWHPHTCSLHLYPQVGNYAARWTRLSMHRPAQVFTLWQGMIFFQPDRFASEEFPCAEVLQAVQKHHAQAFRVRRFAKKHYPRELLSKPIQQVLLLKDYALIDFDRPFEKKNWKPIARKLSVKNLVLRYRSEEQLQKQILCFTKN